MATEIKLRATEDSAYFVDVSFEDEDESPVTPNTVSWTLTDLSGTVINGRSGVSVTPATSVTIVLSGDDLDVGDATVIERRIKVEAPYTSPTTGSEVPFVAEAKFKIDGVVAS